MSELITVIVRHCQSSRWKIRLGPLLERKAHVRSRSQSGGKIPTGNMSIKSKTRMVCCSRRAIGWPRRSSAKCDNSRCGVLHAASHHTICLGHCSFCTTGIPPRYAIESMLGRSLTICVAWLCYNNDGLSMPPNCCPSQLFFLLIAMLIHTIQDELPYVFYSWPWKGCFSQWQHQRSFGWFWFISETTCRE